MNNEQSKEQINKYLSEYLEFLINDLRADFNNYKAIYHRLFEYYLEKYQEVTRNTGGQEIIKHRQQKPQQLNELETKIKDLLKDHTKYDQNHLLVLFKMYDYSPGLIYLYKEMSLTEEMLNYYIVQKEKTNVINHCREYGKTETNLWVQAIKYFASSGSSQELRIILDEIKNHQSLSPLLILNILAVDGHIDFETVRDFFIHKLEKERQEIDADQQKVEQNVSKAKDYRQQYYLLKTQAKKFQENKCSHQNCDHQITLPSVHFLCGHSFSEQCLTQNYDEEKDPSGRLQCTRCFKDHNHTKNQKQDYDAQVNDSKQYFDQLQTQSNKFMIVSQQLGLGIFRK